MKWFVSACLVLIASCSGSDSKSPVPLNDNPSDPGTTLAPVNDGAPGGAVTINRDNHIEILAQVFKVYTGDAIHPRFREIPVRVSDFGPLLADGASIPSYSCDNGGLVTVNIIEEFGYSSSAFDFNNCQLGESLLNGDFRLIESDEETLRSSPAGLRIEYANGETMEFTGGAAFGCCFSLTWYARTRDLYYNYSTGSNMLQLSAANTRFDDGIDIGSGGHLVRMTGEFQLQSSALNAQPLSVNIQSDFEYKSAMDFSGQSGQSDDAWTFSTGELRITATDSSEIILQAQSDDPSSARITISNFTGTETFNQPWSIWQDILQGSNR